MEKKGDFWISLLSGAELLKEKQRDFRNIVLTQVLIVAGGLVLSGPPLEDPRSAPSKLIIAVFSGFGVLYTYLLWDLLRNFSRSRLLLITFFMVFVIITTTGVLLEFPYYAVIHTTNREGLLLLIHACYFPIEITVIAYAIRDIFSGQFLTPDKLWGSACVYLMIGIAFGSLYHIICLALPAGLGVQSIDPGFPNYSECIAYSFRTLGGMDTNYPNAAKLIQNISVIESIWGSLFTVLIIGKLLGLPKPSQTGSIVDIQNQS